MPTILVADDERVIIFVIRRVLEKEGHSVYHAMNSAEADQHALTLERIHVLIIDHFVTPHRGRDVAERIAKRHPDIKVIHMSGRLKAQVEEEDGILPGAHFLQKPFKPRELLDAVARAVA